MNPQHKLLTDLRQDLATAWEQLQLDHKIAKSKELEEEAANPELWKNPQHARTVNEQLARLEEEIQPWQILRTQLSDLDDLIELGGAELATEISEQLDACAEQLANLKAALRFAEPYDHGDAILRITSGVGGTEAMDWAGMLERMYLRFAERHHLKVQLLDRITGEEAGIKTAVYEISGADAYGLLRSEHGVHRLVRLSPFNADHLRQTSFALVEILPVIHEESAPQISEKDLRIDTYHSGGHGGQGVNTTNSAVRITHLPTGIAVAIQNERSQTQNKAKAMEILRGKLLQMQAEQHAASISELRAGESGGWGQQIRNYVLQPYKLVKDTRTGHESKEPHKVLDGELDDFINVFLEKQIKTD